MAAIVQVIGRTAASHEIKFCKLWTFLVRFCCGFRSNATCLRARAHQLNSFVFTSDKNYCLRSDAHCSLLRCCLQSHLKIILIIYGDSAISSSHSRHLNRFNYFYVLFFSISVRNKWIKFESTVARRMWHQMKTNKFQRRWRRRQLICLVRFVFEWVIKQRNRFCIHHSRYVTSTNFCGNSDRYCRRYRSSADNIICIMIESIFVDHVV